jgi:hypothetical protein
MPRTIASGAAVDDVAMVDDPNVAQKSFLRRWSERKHAAAREAIAPRQAPLRTEPAEAAAPAVVTGHGNGPAANPPNASPYAEATQDPPLPPVESLTFESDFSAFMSSKVDEPVKRQALKKLFSDPHFNVMDGLDVYIDDYSKFDPIPPDVLAKLEHARFVLDPPKTRVNARGEVEDVPPDEASREAESAVEPAAEPPQTVADVSPEAGSDLPAMPTTLEEGTDCESPPSEAGGDADAAHAPFPPEPSPAAAPALQRAPHSDEPHR